MNRENRYMLYIGLMLGLLLPLLLMALGGCSSTKLTRTGDSVTVDHKTLFMRTEMPQLYVRKDGEYEASFNAGERSVDLDDVTKVLEKP